MRARGTWRRAPGIRAGVGARQVLRLGVALAAVGAPPALHPAHERAFATDFAGLAMKRTSRACTALSLYSAVRSALARALQLAAAQTNVRERPRHAAAAAAQLCACSQRALMRSHACRSHAVRTAIARKRASGRACRDRQLSTMTMSPHVDMSDPLFAAAPNCKASAAAAGRNGFGREMYVSCRWTVQLAAVGVRTDASSEKTRRARV
jgi:hypothetical protein